MQPENALKNPRHRGPGHVCLAGPGAALGPGPKTTATPRGTTNMDVTARGADVIDMTDGQGRPFYEACEAGNTREVTRMLECYNVASLLTSQLEEFRVAQRTYRLERRRKK